MVFNRESEFEEALINILLTKGWEEVIKNPTEEELIDNWAGILFDNNRDIDRLDNCPLTSGEMQQIIEQINILKTPLKLNGFINGKTVSIKRDNPDDAVHFGKEVSLKIYDRQEIAAGQSRYQIVQQPKFPTRGILNDRRGDLMLLINGMPVIHIELKRSGIPASQATRQIENYSREGIFSGLFALVQVFVAMNPDETLYFANPGSDGRFNPDFYFHWANFDNEPMNDWKDVASSFLSIPMAHQIIGFYTVPDDSDGVLKIMRSYQYYAASAISDKVARTKWGERDHLYGGYVWHTTGSGKTMTSFKSAQLIANSKDADKVIFLMDRIELGTQSLKEYRGFAEENDDVQATENTQVLIAKLKSGDPANTLIVTSIQKMSNIKEDGMNASDLAKMVAKRIVFIVDECHRSTFGEMLITIKNTFPAAIFFGFTGTPIHEENERRGNTTATVFGNELHRYSIADGIRDKNVLGFDPYMVETYKGKDLRTAVALDNAKAESVEEAVNDPEKDKIYRKFMDSSKIKMAGDYDSLNKYVNGIEDYLPKVQYEQPEHREMVVQDILENWAQYSHGGEFHAIFATSSIPEAIAYWRLIKEKKPDFKVTALFDPNIDNMDGVSRIEDEFHWIDTNGIEMGDDVVVTENAIQFAITKDQISRRAYKQDGLVEIITEYNARYGQSFELGTHGKFKKDIAARLSHKSPYKRIEHEPEKQIELIIVVDQMLTGFDSKWVNTLYMDKILEGEHIIQAFSRTNRLFGPNKPFGVIRYYRKPHTMTRLIGEAVSLYSGNRSAGLFVQRLPDNLKAMNEIFAEIKEVFRDAGVSGFEKNPGDKESRGMFAKLFKILNNHLEAAEIQGFKWDVPVYEFKNEFGRKDAIKMDFDETTYLILAQRYKELLNDNGGGGDGDIPFEIDGHLTEIDTEKIDADYMNSRFEKYLRLVNLPEAEQGLIDQALSDLHKTFATLTQEEQKYANIFLHEIQRGEVTPEEGKRFRDYITEYQARAKDDQIHGLAVELGLDETQLRSMIELKLTEANINEYGRFDSLKGSIDKTKARAFFEQEQGTAISLFKVNNLLDEFLRKFLLEGGFDLEAEDGASAQRKHLGEYSTQPQPCKVAEDAEDAIYKT